jgi:ferric-dicitrate binding protein FerR (iron transport regulator)
MKKELLQKYCNNQCTQEQIEYILSWFDESAPSSEGKTLLFEIWNDIQDEESNHNVDFDVLLDKIHHKVNLSGTQKLLETEKRDLKLRPDIIDFFTRAAAILLIPVFCFGLYFSVKYFKENRDQDTVNTAYNEVFSSVDAITKVTLPDGSNVWLNHSSSIRYPAVFLNNNRNVELKGEGYFEVTANPDKPFIVTAGEIQIMAVGTAFNVMAYPDEPKIETSLISGYVELRQKKSDGKTISLAKMKPTDLAVFQKNNSEITTRTIKDDRYFAWKDGRLVLENEPIREVVKKLSRWFNIEIEVNDPRLLELTYTGTFVDESLPQVLELISMVSPVSYSISDRIKISSGIFSKRKIILNFRDRDITNKNNK